MLTVSYLLVSLITLLETVGWYSHYLRYDTI